MNFTTNIVLVEHTIFTFLNVQMLIALCMNPKDLEKFLILGSLYQNPGKRTHGIQFTPTEQTAIHVGKIVKYIHCLKARVVYAKKQLSDARKRMMKPMLNYFQYVCGTVFHDLPIDDKNKDSYNLEMLHCRENLTCESPMEIPHYSSKLFKNLCFYCGRQRNIAEQY